MSSSWVAGVVRAKALARRRLGAAGARDLCDETDDTCHLNGTARMGDDPRTSVVNADCRSWDIPNLWVCDGSVFPTVGGVNPSLTIQANRLPHRRSHQGPRQRRTERLAILAPRGGRDESG